MKTGQPSTKTAQNVDGPGKTGQPSTKTAQNVDGRAGQNWKGKE